MVRLRRRGAAAPRAAAPRLLSGLLALQGVLMPAPCPAAPATPDSPAASAAPAAKAPAARRRSDPAAGASAAAAAVIRQAQALLAKDSFAEAVGLLEAASRSTSDTTDLRRLQLFLAEVQHRHGSRLVTRARHTEAIPHLEAAYALNRNYSKVKAGKDLRRIGDAYLRLGEPRTAAGYYERARALASEAKERADEGIALGYLGHVYARLSQLEKAVGCYEQALELHKEVGDRDSRVRTLNFLGISYVALGQHEKAAGCHQQALDIARRAGLRAREGDALNGLGNAHRGLGQHAKAAVYYEQAVKIAEEGNPVGRGDALNNLGSVYADLGQFEKAARLQEQALGIAKDKRNVLGEGNALNGLGNAHRGLGQHAKAAVYYEQALMIFRRTGNRGREGDALNNLMSAWSALKQPGLAVFFGKHAVNVYQSIRADIRGLDEETQQSFVGTKEGAYRTLADLLIEQGRLPEAQQVLNLLKEREFFEFVRRDAGAAGEMGSAGLNALEAEADARIRAVGARVTETGARYESLRAKERRTAEEAARLDTLGAELDTANAAFQKVLDGLAALFAARAASVAAKPLDLRDSEALTNTLARLRRQTRHGALAVYTLVGENRLRFLVYTDGGAPVARDYPITAVELNKKVAAFRRALRDPYVDPRPLGKQLYDILIRPVEGDLRGANATRVMWSLDGALRYLPVAALSPDGKHYLVERAESAGSIFTPATLNGSALTADTAPGWSALALGASRAATVGNVSFDALPGVPAEIAGVVGSGGAGSGGGVLPGRALLDGAFTREALTRALRDGRGRFPVVHIASHFRFEPGGDMGRSFLVLGDGTALTLAEIKDQRAGLFSGVQLLTLSACDTATTGKGSGGDGSEVESFAVLAQRKGAEAVLATLWKVADTSTPSLMRAFYRIRQAEPALGKAEALRRAQVEMLTGGAQGTPHAAAAAPAAIPPRKAPGGQAAADGDLPPFTPDPKARFAHPFFWAPFVLIGNWK